jgi:hypothetical protein
VFDGSQKPDSGFETVPLAEIKAVRGQKKGLASGEAQSVM